MKIRFPGNELDYKPDWKSMKLSDKAGYIWDYYKIPIAIALVMIYLAGYFCYRYVTRKYPVLYVDAVNLTLGEDLSGALADGYKEAAGLQPRETVVISDSLYITDDGSSPAYMHSQTVQIKLTAVIAAQQLDLVLMNAEACDLFSRNAQLMNLEKLMESDELSQQQKELLSQLSSHFVKNTVVVEDNSDELALNPDAEYTAVTREEVNAIDLSSSPFFNTEEFKEQVFLGIISNTPRPDTALSFIGYLW